MKIYSTEINDGLKDLVESPIILSSRLKSDTKIIEPLQYAFAKANPGQKDLDYRYCILASTGWNENTDVFLAEQIWAARETPEDKQLNFMHDDSYIIGHMTEAFILDFEGNIIEKKDDLPDKFDIGVGFVLYKALANKERCAQVKKIIEEIDEGKWYVSMECRFPNFDYAVIDPDGEEHIIARNQETSFLTKHLLAYGGKGEYQGHKLGRVPKELFFSGIGIVDDPANKRSVIFTKENFSKASSIKKENVMEEELKQLKAQLDAANAKIADLESAKSQEVVKDLEDKIKAEAAAKDKAEKDKKAAEESYASAKTELETAKASLAETVKKLEDANAVIEAAKVEKAKADRIGALVKVGLEEAQAAEVYTKWAGVSDEQFAEIVPLYAKKDMKEEKKEEKVEDAKADFKGAVTEQATAGNQVTETDTDVIEAVASWFASTMPVATAAKNKNKKEEN